MLCCRAAARGGLRCAELLVEAGADLVATDSSGRTPVQLALAFNQRVMHDYLVSQG